MSECFLNYHIEDRAAVKCGDCEWEGMSADLDMVSDVQDRLDPGSVVPAGQCPECGALAYLMPDKDEAAVIAAAQELYASHGESDKHVSIYEDARVHVASGGYRVEAWVFVPAKSKT